MELQRNYDYVPIDGPYFEQNRLAGRMEEASSQNDVITEVSPWPDQARTNRLLSHIQFLLIVVLLLTGLAFWVVFRPGKTAFANGPRDLPADGGFALFNGTESSDEDSMLVNVEPGLNGDGLETEFSALSALFTPEVRYWEKQILHWAAEYEVDPNVVATIMQIESCGNPGAASYAGAQGLFQVMPFHFQPGEDMLDPNTNAMRGLAFFQEQMRYTGGDIFLSFAGYNGGYAASGGAYENWAAETQRYYYWAKGIYLDASSGAERSSRLDEWLFAGGGGGCQIAAASLGI